MIAVVETEEFLADVKSVLSEDEHDALILYVARHPETGDLIPGSARADIPLFLMAIYAKSTLTDLAPRPRKELVQQLRALRTEWKKKGPK